MWNFIHGGFPSFRGSGKHHFNTCTNDFRFLSFWSWVHQYHIVFMVLFFSSMMDSPSLVLTFFLRTASLYYIKWQTLVNLDDFLGTLSATDSAFRVNVKWPWTLNSSLLAGSGVPGLWKIFSRNCQCSSQVFKKLWFYSTYYFLVSSPALAHWCFNAVVICPKNMWNWFYHVDLTPLFSPGKIFLITYMVFVCNKSMKTGYGS